MNDDRLMLMLAVSLATAKRCPVGINIDAYAVLGRLPV